MDGARCQQRHQFKARIFGLQNRRAVVREMDREYFRKIAKGSKLRGLILIEGSYGFL